MTSLSTKKEGEGWVPYKIPREGWVPIFFLALLHEAQTLVFILFSGRSWDGLMARTLCCGHSDPGSIPGLNKIPFYFFDFVEGTVAKWGSRWAHNPKVRGSKPRHACTFVKTIKHSCFTLYQVYWYHLKLQMGRLPSPSDPAPFCVLYNQLLTTLTN